MLLIDLIEGIQESWFSMGSSCTYLYLYIVHVASCFVSMTQFQDVTFLIMNI